MEQLAASHKVKHTLNLQPSNLTSRYLLKKKLVTTPDAGEDAENMNQSRGPRTAMKSGPRLPQLEKALAQKRRPNTANT